jgi:phosphatidyl-myo-inositol dimannoside synthase
MPETLLRDHRNKGEEDRMQPECLIVTQCFYPDTGGIEGLMTALADRCALAGQTVTVLADRIRHRTPGPPAPKPYAIVRFGGPRPWRRWRKKACLSSIVQQRGDGLTGIFADSWKSIEALPTGLTVPVSVLAHGMEFPHGASPGKRQRIAAALARCNAVIANSNYTAGLVRPFLGGQAHKLIVIHPPVAPLPAPSAAAQVALREKIAGRHPVIATVARLEPRKGADAVIRAMPDVLRHHPSCIYAIAGAGGDRGRLEELAGALNVKEAVLFLGRVDDEEKTALLMQTDVFAMPVRREGQSVEGFGISYLEAGLSGIATLAGRDGGAPDAVLDGQTGLVCDGAAQDSITAALLRLLGDEALRVRLGAAARKRAINELSWDAAIGRYLASFKLPV